MPHTFITTFMKQKQVDLSEFEASLNFIVNSRIEKPISKDSISKSKLNDKQNSRGHNYPERSRMDATMLYMCPGSENTSSNSRKKKIHFL